MKNFIPAIIWAGIIFWLSAGAGINLPETWLDMIGTDKIGHAIFYMVLSVLLLWGLERSRNEIPDKNSAYFLIAVSSFYGVLMEIMQYAFYPGRYFEVLDIIANIIGSFTGLYLYNYFFIKKS